MVRRRGLGVLLTAAIAAGAAGACEESRAPERPAPTPGPQLAVSGLPENDDGVRELERGARVRFAVAGTGAGTRFGPATFLQSPAFAELRVVAVESTSRLWAQGLVSLASGEGEKDLAAVTGDELAVGRGVFTVVPTRITNIGTVPCASDAAAGTDANVLDPPGDFDVYALAPPTDAIRTLLVRVERAPGAPPTFHPTLDLYATDGTPLASSAHGCAAATVRSRSTVYARVSDPGGAGGTEYSYRVAASFGEAEACLASWPGELPPGH